MAKYEEVRNQAQEPNSRTEKLVRNIQDKAGVAKEDQQDGRRLPAYTTVEVARDQTGMVMEIPPIKIGIAVQNQEVMDSLLAGDGVEEDLPKTRTRKMIMGYLEVSGEDEVPGVIQDPRDRRDRGGPQDRWDPGEYPGDYLPLVWGTRSYHPQM